MPKGENKNSKIEKVIEKSEEEPFRRKVEAEIELENWIPKTEAGKLVKANKIKTLDELIEKGLPILEPEIIDTLIPELQNKIVYVGKTTRVTPSGRVFSFRTAVLVGHESGYIGIGTGKDSERWPAIRKATKQAKLSLKKIIKGTWDKSSGIKHTIPFRVKGKSASVRLELLPAPRGTGLVVGDNIKDVFKFVGINDVWSQSIGNTRTTLNYVRAAVDALAHTTKVKMNKFYEVKMK